MKPSSSSSTRRKKNPKKLRFATATMYPCGSSIDDWTLPTLIGSYIDVLLALLLLIGSTLVFLGSTLLSLFGLSLPCPCDGLLGCPSCLHARLRPVHRAIRARPPFDAVLSGPPPPEEDDGSLVVGRRPASGRVRKRRGRSGGGGRSGCLSLLGEEEGGSDGSPEQHRAITERRRARDDVDSGLHDLSLVNETAPTTECYDHDTEETPSDGIDLRVYKENEPTSIQHLKWELEDARTAYSALCIELEKERSAAATAADEAMAMILRLQTEKAVVEMESSQYRRMIEEKFVYDEEEVEVLKEIIVKREREKHVLEKEVEAYRQMMNFGEMIGKKNSSFFNSPEDPTDLLKTIYESVKNKEKVGRKMKWAEDCEGVRSLESPDPGDELHLEVQEKSMLTMDIYPSCGKYKSSSIEEDCVRCDLNKSQELEFSAGNSCSILGEDGQCESKIVMGIPVENLNEEEDPDSDQRGNNSSQFDIDSNVLDIHVIDDKTDDASQTGGSSELHGKGDAIDELSGVRNIDTAKTISVKSCLGVAGDIQISCSDLPKGGHLLDSPSEGTSFNLRRSSMSAIDSERFTLETEVEILRKRLKTIQQGREKLSFPLEHQGKENCEMEILEEIACQLQQIRKITDPGKGIHQTSLPPLPSKANPKKRRCRSVSWGLHESA